MTWHFLLLSPIEGSSGLPESCSGIFMSTNTDIVVNLHDSYHLTPKIVANLAVDGIYLTFLKDYESSRST